MTLPRIDLAPGITTFDCADLYTGVEEPIGAFIRARRGATPIQVHTNFDTVRLRELLEAGIQLLCYGGVAGGFLSDRYQALLRVLQAVAARHAVSIATVALRWVLEQSRVAGVIVGARHHRHLADLQRVETLALTPVDLAEIAGVQAGTRGPAGDVYELERVPGGVHASIVRYTLNSAIR